MKISITFAVFVTVIIFKFDATLGCFPSIPLTPLIKLQIDNAIPDASVFKWKDMGFTTCSESCLGGLQESKIICVDRDGDAVSPMHCAEMERPEMMVRTCNDHPCPPRYLILIQYRLFFVRSTHSCIN